MNSKIFKKNKKLIFIGCKRPLKDGSFDDSFCNCKDDCQVSCLNKSTLIQCNKRNCLKEHCGNRPFKKSSAFNLDIKKVDDIKGYGLITKEVIPPNEFILEYVGEVIDCELKKKRENVILKQQTPKLYFANYFNNMFFIDGMTYGNLSRFINHSCESNAEMQSWLVDGLLRAGIFSIKTINQDEEITTVMIRNLNAIAIQQFVQKNFNKKYNIILGK